LKLRLSIGYWILNRDLNCYGKFPFFLLFLQVLLLLTIERVAERKRRAMKREFIVQR